MKKTPAYRVALCGILGALAVVLMMLGGIVPVAVYCCPLLACLLLVPLLELFSKKLCIGWYLVVSLLSLLLVPDKETALVFTFLGWYPIARAPINKLPKALRFFVKFLIFNTAVIAMYALMIYVFQMQAVVEEFRTTGLPLLIVMAVLANVVFFVLDLLLDRMTFYFHHKNSRM